MATDKEAMKVWMVLVVAYPTHGREVGEAVMQQTAKLYARLLADLPVPLLMAAAEQHIASSKWFPTVAELRAQVASIQRAALPERGGLEAWGIVQETFTDGGYYQYDDGHATTPEFDDPLITATLKALGGYWHLYGLIRDPHGNPAADRARFVECYETLRRRQNEEALLLPGVRALRQQIKAGGGVLQLPDPEQMAKRGPARAAQVDGVMRQLAEKAAE